MRLDRIRVPSVTGAPADPRDEMVTYRRISAELPFMAMPDIHGVNQVVGQERGIYHREKDLSLFALDALIGRGNEGVFCVRQIVRSGEQHEGIHYLFEYHAEPEAPSSRKRTARILAHGIHEYLSASDTQVKDSQREHNTIIEKWKRRYEH